jgi:hypothetical protein
VAEVIKPSREEQRFRTPECAEFWRVYRQLQHDSGVIAPPRRMLNLRSVPTAAPYFGIFEVKGPDEIRVRLIGTGFVLRTGIDNTGRNALDIVPEALRDWTAFHFRRMAETPCGSICISRETYGGARMLTEVLSLPFADTSGRPVLIVSASIPFERPEYIPDGDKMSIGGFHDVAYLDIGAGTGATHFMTKSA